MHTNNITYSRHEKASTPKEMVKKRAMSVGKLIALIMGILLILSLFRNIQTLISADQTIQKASLKRDMLEQQNLALKNQADEVQRDYFLEKQARDKLGYGKEGEAALVLPPEEILRRLAPKSPPEEEQALPQANWQKWLRLFF